MSGKWLVINERVSKHDLLIREEANVQSLAETLEDGRELMNAEMKKPKYHNHAGKEVFIDVAVRVQPENEPSFESKMKVSLLKSYLLKPGIRVLVKYDPTRKEQVIMEDEPAQILERNPPLKK